MLKKINKKSEAYDEVLYKKQSINNLIIFSIYSVIKSDEKCTFEKLIKECFVLFPKTFSLSQYPKWPDSRKIDRPLRFLKKNKNLIIDNSKTYFSLTKSGEKVAEELTKIFKQKRLNF